MALKFSREFQSLQAVKSEFTLAKPPNSLENFSAFSDLLCTKAFPNGGFSLSKLSVGYMGASILWHYVWPFSHFFVSLQANSKVQ